VNTAQNTLTTVGTICAMFKFLNLKEKTIIFNINLKILFTSLDASEFVKIE